MSTSADLPRSDRLVLLGGGGHASDVLSVVEAVRAEGERWSCVYVADDAWVDRSRFEGRRVSLVESIDEAIALAPYLLATGYPASRRAIDERARRGGGQAAPALIHPRAEINASSWVGAGSVILGASWISACTRIGTHCYVSCNCTIGHDAVLGDFVSVFPGARVNGNVTGGDDVMIGANAVILPGCTIGAGARIGAGAVVTDDVAAGMTVVGVPARALAEAPVRPVELDLRPALQ